MSANQSLRPHSATDSLCDFPSEYVYLVQERNFARSGRPLYLVKSVYSESPSCAYPHASRVVAKILCSSQIHSDAVVETAKTLFDTMFEQRRYIGIDYYTGNYKNMVSALAGVVAETNMV